MKDSENSVYYSGQKLKQLEPWEYQYYTLNFNCSEAELTYALQEVGNAPEKLLAFFGK